jgi:hypothetical protein
MEADWEFEIGPDAPVIDAHWEGLIDLARHPERAADLPEATDLPELAEALVRLNNPETYLRTSKCDLWRVDPEEQQLDSDELDTPSEAIGAACACYIDLTAREPLQWENPDQVAQTCTALCAYLRSAPLRCCRADLVIRQAILADEKNELGITAYLTACGPSEEAAKSTLVQALHVFTDFILAVQTR